MGGDACGKERREKRLSVQYIQKKKKKKQHSHIYIFIQLCEEHVEGVTPYTNIHIYTLPYPFFSFPLLWMAIWKCALHSKQLYFPTMTVTTREIQHTAGKASRQTGRWGLESVEEIYMDLTTMPCSCPCPYPSLNFAGEKPAREDERVRAQTQTIRTHTIKMWMDVT